MGPMGILEIKISSAPMDSYGVQWILAITFHQIQWNLMGPMRFFRIRMESYGSHEVFSNQILSNPMESNGAQEILAIKSHQIQWNLRGPMRF